MAHMIAVKDKQSTGAWIRMSDGAHVGYINQMDDALAIVHAYNLSAPHVSELSQRIHARLDNEVRA